VSKIENFHFRKDQITRNKKQTHSKTNT